MCVLLMSHSHTSAASFSGKSSELKALAVPLSFWSLVFLRFALGDIKRSKMTVEFMLNQEVLKDLVLELKAEVLFAFDTANFAPEELPGRG